VARATADSVEHVRQLALAAEASARIGVELADMVHFGLDQSWLTTEARVTLDRKVAILNANPTVRLQLAGATDERGSDLYNMALGHRRADAVRQYLIGKGIAVLRLQKISTGESSPIDAASTEAAWTQNRRVEFTIVSGDRPLATN